jgi:hypothetical protein
VSLGLARKSGSFYGKRAASSSFSKHLNHYSMQTPKIYAPGLLSLLLLFPLFLYLLAEWHIFDKQYMMEVSWYEPKIMNNCLPPYPAFPPPKKYALVNLTGEASHDSIALQSAKGFIQQIAARFDTIHGVRIHFTDTAKYESLVHMLDFCYQQDALTCVPYENDLWIFNRIANEEQKEMSNFWRGSCIVMTYPDIESEKQNFAWAYANVLDKKFWPLGAIFTLLIVLSFRRRFALKAGRRP